jgi:hypothetical protein
VRLAAALGRSPTHLSSYCVSHPSGSSRWSGFVLLIVVLLVGGGGVVEVQVCVAAARCSCVNRVIRVIRVIRIITLTYTLHTASTRYALSVVKLT